MYRLRVKEDVLFDLFVENVMVMDDDFVKYLFVLKIIYGILSGNIGNVFIIDMDIGIIKILMWLDREIVV